MDENIDITSINEETPHLQVILKDGYVDSYATIGSLDGGVEVTPLEDMEYFEAHYNSYKLVDGELVFDPARNEDNELQQLKNNLRERREKECFAVVDRSPLWYNSLTVEQRSELQTWYNAWLVVTETLVVPDKPEWL